MKLILFANTDWYLYNFRLDLAQALKQAGYDVLLMSPDGPFRVKMQTLGYQWIHFPLSRRGINPLAEIWNLVRLFRIYQREKPDIVHHFTIKCVVLGSTAAHLSGVKTIVNSITGLGYVFLSERLETRFLRRLVKTWYKLVLGRTKVIFQNRDDMAFFLKEAIILPDEASLIAGSGVDIIMYSPVFINKSEVPLVVLASRMLYDKGIVEYVESARCLKRMGIAGRFILVGNVDMGNPSAIPEKQLEDWQKEGIIEWWGWRDNMLEVYQQAQIACLPSYREGLPKMLIEAGACGLPLVAADVPGCHDVVFDGENGFLVKPRDVDSLVEALHKLLTDEALRFEMGQRSRMIVEERFSLKTIIDKTLSVYKGTEDCKP